MHLKHGPDNTAGDTIASTDHPECPPDGAAGEPLVNNDNPEDGPEGHPTATTGPQDDHQTPDPGRPHPEARGYRERPLRTGLTPPSKKSGGRPSEPTTLSSTGPFGKSAPTRTGTSTRSSTRRSGSSGKPWRGSPGNTPASSRTWKQETGRIGSNTTG